MTYQPTIETQTNPKKGISMVELFQRDDIRDNYTKERTKLTMDEIQGRPLRIMSWELFSDKNLRGEMTEFIRFRYYLDDDEDDLKETSTQAVDIKDRLRAIPNEMIGESGGILAIIEATKLPSGGKKYTFAGVR